MNSGALLKHKQFNVIRFYIAANVYFMIYNHALYIAPEITIFKTSWDQIA
jgi:hypothetical protein